MDIQEILGHARDTMTVKRVFGDPYERNGTLVVPVAGIRGGAGGGVGTSDPGANRRGGGGFGLVARPVGVYTIKDGGVTWQPALDLNRVILGGQVVAVVALFVVWRVFRVVTRPHARK